jgi:predicted phage-related endonuclease
MFTLTNYEIEVIINTMICHINDNMLHKEEFINLLEKLQKEHKFRESSIKVIKNSFYGK